LFGRAVNVRGSHSLPINAYIRKKMTITTTEKMSVPMIEAPTVFQQRFKVIERRSRSALKWEWM
jgi:hypothetical protein